MSKIFEKVAWQEKQKAGAERRQKYTVPKRDLSKPFRQKRDVSRLSELY
jgi:hypothetical protein